MSQLRVTATAHAVNYLPQHLAQATGAFGRRGLEVTFTPRDPWTGVLADLDDGSADVALGGAWVPAMYAGRGRGYTIVGQLNARFPRILVSRVPIPGFTWDQLDGLTVLAPGAGGTAPYEFTAGLMREAGFDPSRVRFVRDLSAPMLGELFANGLGDALISDFATAHALSASGVAHVALDLADAAGPMPNSVYYVLPGRRDELHDRLVAFLGGVREAMLALQDGADASAVIAAQYGDGPARAQHAAASAFTANGTWSGVRIEPPALDRWVGILRAAGLVTTDVGHADLVDSRVVDAVEARVAPADAGA